MKVDKRRWHHLDSHIIAIALVLFLIGMMNLFSATSSFQGGSYNFVLKQFVAFIIGIVVIVFILWFDYESTSEYSRWFYGVGGCLILAVLLYGGFVKGSRRWVLVFGLSFQPSELMKPILVLFLAQTLSVFKKEHRLMNPRNICKPLLSIVVPVGLIMLQPDLGTGMVILFVSLSMLWFVGMEKKVYVMFISAGVLLALAAKYLLKPYQLERVYTWFKDPFEKNVDASGSLYHIKQAMIAIGSGKFFGKGYMKGTQHKLMFVPEHHTDFIFTVFAEEWGFAGSIVLFLLFIAFIARCLKISRQSKNELGSIIAFGMASILYFQFAVNVLMTMGIAPVVGIPLPFISYGGSSLLSVLVSVGFLLNVSMRRYMF